MHNTDAHCRRDGFLNDRNPIGRSDGEYTDLVMASVAAGKVGKGFGGILSITYRLLPQNNTLYFVLFSTVTLDPRDTEKKISVKIKKMLVGKIIICVTNFLVNITERIDLVHQELLKSSNQNSSHINVFSINNL